MNNDFNLLYQLLTQDFLALEAVLLSEQYILSQGNITASALQSNAEEKRRLIETIQYRYKQSQSILLSCSIEEEPFKQELQETLIRLQEINQKNGIVLEARIALNQERLDLLAPHCFPESYCEQGQFQTVIHKRYQSIV